MALFAAGPAPAQGLLEPPECAGREATLTGTLLGDVIRGTDKRDVVVAGEGDDIVIALGARDIALRWRGQRHHRRGPGDDLAFGGFGDDRIVGGIGNDRCAVRAERTPSRVAAATTTSTAAATAIRRRQPRRRRVYGGPGVADQVAGGLGIDRVNGGPGNYDLVHGDYGWDRMLGGPGLGDIASFFTAVSGQQGPGQEIRPPGVNASLPRGLAIGDGRDILRSFESLEGSAFDDVLTAGQGRAAQSMRRRQ